MTWVLHINARVSDIDKNNLINKTDAPDIVKNFLSSFAASLPSSKQFIVHGSGSETSFSLQVGCFNGINNDAEHDGS